jgi:hypothetical protein
MKRSLKTLPREYWLFQQLLHLENPCLDDTSLCFIITVVAAMGIQGERHLLPTQRMVPVSTMVASLLLRTQLPLLIPLMPIWKSVEFWVCAYVLNKKAVIQFLIEFYNFYPLSVFCVVITD